MSQKFYRSLKAALGHEHPRPVNFRRQCYKLLLENERVRVLDLRLKPGEKAPMHNHPHDHVIYVMTNSRAKLTFPDGKSSVFDLKAGQALWLEAGSHATENIGTSEGHNLVVEVKK